ncbi:hypothetical protein ILUMI_18268 [Ignelater luminosus]|uniref:Tc1-like transposase DDE domain-containing protein n=1 Tax=Ignelater luminosus TaxID=2038154 RepID=A0A8K0CIC6_IGNLU|nr:hypothetical protein ILUMI_18268 [Ignelater luminosus]
MKDQIWGLVKNKIPKEKVYHLDEYDEQHGHCVLRLPPYHCHFNTIEIVWSKTKRHCNRSATHRKGDIICMGNRKLLNIKVNELIINVNGNSGDSSDFNDSDSSDI